MEREEKGLGVDCRMTFKFVFMYNGNRVSQQRGKDTFSARPQHSLWQLRRQTCTFIYMPELLWFPSSGPGTGTGVGC